MISSTALYFVVVVIVLQTQFFQTCTQQVETDNELLVVQSMKALAKSISYFHSRENRVTAQELLAVRIAKDALLTAVENCVNSPVLYVPEAIIEELKLLCAKLNVLIPRILNIHNPSNMTQSFKNYISSGWPGFLPYKSIKIDKVKRKELKTMAQVLPLDFHLCLGDLSQHKNCFLSDNCLKVVEPKMVPESCIAYQAAILSTLQALSCTDKINDKWKEVTVDDLTDDICYMLYPKVSTFHASIIFQEEDDILSFLDAFFVCSLLGFEDFLQVTHMRLSAIIEWQLPSGCFGFTATAKKDRACLPGMTSAVIAQLGLYLKWLLDPKGFALSSGKEPFKRPMWLMFIVKIILIIGLLIPLFVKKVRRLLFGILGRFFSFVHRQVAKFYS